jgi:hypothetical protein
MANIYMKWNGDNIVIGIKMKAVEYLIIRGDQYLFEYFNQNIIHNQTLF